MGEAGRASQKPLRMQLYCWQLSDFFPTELNPTSVPIRRCYGNVDGGRGRGSLMQLTKHSLWDL